MQIKVTIWHCITQSLVKFKRVIIVAREHSEESLSHTLWAEVAVVTTFQEGNLPTSVEMKN